MNAKYICLKEGDDFITEDEAEAKNHLQLGTDHKVAEVIPMDEGVDANILGDTGEDLEDDDLAEEENMTKEEEEE
jgi:hypothetical protein